MDLPDTKINDEIANRFLAQIRICFRNGHRSAAISAVNQAFDTANQECSADIETPLINVLEYVTANSLEFIDVFTIGDLLLTSEKKVATAAQIGTHRIERIRIALQKHGFVWPNRDLD